MIFYYKHEKFGRFRTPGLLADAIGYENLNYEQFRWDDRNISYYVNAEGELIVRINQKYTYDENSSSNGL